MDRIEMSRTEVISNIVSLLAGVALLTYLAVALVRLECMP